MITLRSFVVGLSESPATRKLVVDPDGYQDLLGLAKLSMTTKIPFLEVIDWFRSQCWMGENYGYSSQGTYVLSSLEVVIGMWQQYK